MNRGFLLALLMLPLTLPAQTGTVPAGQDPQKGQDPRLNAPGTLSGYPSPAEPVPPSSVASPPVLSAPSVLRFHDERRNPPQAAFPQFGRTPGQGNPWERPEPRPPAPDNKPPPLPGGSTNPWHLDDRLLSMPGMPGLDRSLPLAPADPLLTPMPYGSMPGTSYGFYPPPRDGYTGGMPLYPFGGGLLPGYGSDRGAFPFSPMDWF